MEANAERLGVEVRRRLGPPRRVDDPPRVSIVVPNRDGAPHLRRLVRGLADRTDYPRLELVLVDNGSSDGSVPYVREVDAPFPISIVANPHNESFSDACNQGAARAGGELLLFLNNDVEPLEDGWLREMVACHRVHGGAVGATLVHPTDRDGHPHGHSIQHRGLCFRDRAGTIEPVLAGWGRDPLDSDLGRDVGCPVVVAACMLIDAVDFDRVGGFPRGYVYGAEDIDLCLGVRAAGMEVTCSGRSVLVHRPGSTRRAVRFEDARERKLRNYRLLRERWAPRLRREHDLDVSTRTGLWTDRAEWPAAGSGGHPRRIEAAGFCVREATLAAARDGWDRAGGLAAELARRDIRHVVLRGEEVDDERGLDRDVAVHVAGPVRYVPRLGQFNVLWLGAGAPPPARERDAYDLVARGDASALVEAALRGFAAVGFPTRVDGGGPVGGRFAAIAVPVAV